MVAGENAQFGFHFDEQLKVDPFNRRAVCFTPQSAKEFFSVVGGPVKLFCIDEHTMRVSQPKNTCEALEFYDAGKEQHAAG